LGDGTVAEITAALQVAYAPAQERMRRASGAARGLYPCAQDWMTDSEMAEAHRLQLLLAVHPNRSASAARARAEAKRAIRRLRGGSQ